MLNGGLDQFLQAIRPFLYENDVAQYKNLGDGNATIIISNANVTPKKAVNDAVLEQF